MAHRLPPRDSPGRRGMHAHTRVRNSPVDVRVFPSPARPLRPAVPAGARRAHGHAPPRAVEYCLSRPTARTTTGIAIIMHSVPPRPTSHGPGYIFPTTPTEVGARGATRAPRILPLRPSPRVSLPRSHAHGLLIPPSRSYDWTDSGILGQLATTDLASRLTHAFSCALSLTFLLRFSHLLSSPHDIVFTPVHASMLDFFSSLPRSASRIAHAASLRIVLHRISFTLHLLFHHARTRTHTHAFHFTSLAHFTSSPPFVSPVH